MSYTKDVNSLDVIDTLLYDSANTIISDGVTGGRGQIQTPLTRGNLVNSTTLTWRGIVTVPSVATSSFAFIFFIGPTAGPNTGGWTMGSAMWAMFFSNTLYIETTDAATNRRTFSSGLRNIYAGQTGILEVLFTQGTTNPVVRWNDLDISSLFTISAGAPNWIDSSLTSTYLLTAYNWPSGPAPIGSWILGSLTDSERRSWRTTGQPPLWVALGGDTSAISVYSASNSGYEIFSGSTTGFSAEETGSATSSATFYGLPLVPTTAQFFVQFDATLISGAVPFFGISIAGFAYRSATQTVVNGKNTAILSVNMPITSTSNGGVGAGGIAFTTNSINSSYVISNFSVSILGALSLPGISSSYTIDDLTKIGNNSAVVNTGLIPISNVNEFSFSRVLSWSGTHEFKSLGVVIPPNGIITSIDTKATVSSSGTGLTIGSTNSNNRYVTSVTYTTAKKTHTLANKIPAGTSGNDLNLGVDPDSTNYTGTITITVRGYVSGESV